MMELLIPEVQEHNTQVAGGYITGCRRIYNRFVVDLRAQEQGKFTEALKAQNPVIENVTSSKTC